MPGDQVAIAFTADIAGLQAGASQAASTVSQSVREMGAAANEGSGVFGRFTSILQDHRMEMRQESGMARVLSRDLMALGLDAKGAGGEIAHLVSAFAIGGAIGGGIAIMKMLIGVVQELAGAEDEAAARAKAFGDEGAAAAAKFTAKIDEMIAKLRGATPAMALMTSTLAPLLGEQSAATKELAAAEAELKNFQEQGSGFGSRAVDDAEQRVRVAQARLAAVKKQIADAQSDLNRLVNAEEQKAAEKAAADAAAEAKKASEKAADERAKKRAELAKAMADAEIAGDNKAFEHYQAILAAMEQADIAADNRRFEEKLKLEEEIAKAMLEADIAADNKRFEAELAREQKAYEDRLKTIEQFGERAGRVLGNALEKGESPLKATKALLAEMTRDIAQAAIKSITTRAAEAAAGAASSQADIPIFGPALAVGAMAAMEATVLALIGHISSAAGGWYSIPSTQVMVGHEGEQVLPAGYAEGLRDLIAGGGRSGGPAYHFHGALVDRRSIAGLFEDSESPLMRADRQIRRSGRRF